MFGFVSLRRECHDHNVCQVWELDYAYRAFESMDAPDTVAWTAMIAACAHHGKASEAITLFRKMQASGVKMNAVTFVAILNACSHAGLVQEAEEFFHSMSSSEYGSMPPTIYHYNCMIDAYTRAGLLKEEVDLINGMPFEADTMSWKSLLGGCSIHQNYEIGRAAADELLRLDPHDVAAYILLFNMHTSCGRWEEAAGMRRLTAERGVRKETGCSWIRVGGKVHRFVVGDRHHPRAEEVYSKVEEMGFKDESGDGVVWSERKRQQLVHSERLAIAYGLIATAPTSSIVLFKNLRVCRGCHDFGKHVSLVTGREIVVRDANRFHHFVNGECSCQDYW